MFITAQGCRLRNDLYCVEWDVKLYYTIPYHYHTCLKTVITNQAERRATSLIETNVLPLCKTYRSHGCMTYLYMCVSTERGDGYTMFY